MKVVVIILTAFAMLSVFYFGLAFISSGLLARQERKRFPPSGPFGLPALWNFDAYTERGKELMLKQYRALLFAGLAGVAVLVCLFVAWPAVTGRPLARNATGVPVEVMIGSMVVGVGMWGFVGSSVWLLVVLIAGWRHRAQAARAGTPASPVYRQRMLTCLKWIAVSLFVVIVSIFAPIAATYLGR